MSRKAAKITIEDLQALLPVTYINGLYGSDKKFDTILKDWSKINFDLENIIDDENRFYHYVGFHTLDTGLTFLGLECGGDWEWPVFAIIYHDGKKLRGYVPSKGNTYHRETKSAYGSHIDECSDEDDPYEDQEVIIATIDNAAMLEDIRNRITVTETVKPPVYPSPADISLEEFSQLEMSEDIAYHMRGEPVISATPFTHAVVRGMNWATIMYWDGKKVVSRPVVRTANTSYPGTVRSCLGGKIPDEDILATIQNMT